MDRFYLLSFKVKTFCVGRISAGMNDLYYILQFEMIHIEYNLVDGDSNLSRLLAFRNHNMKNTIIQIGTNKVLLDPL